MAHRDVIVIGASAGGVEALQKIARGLPGDLAAAVFVVLHVPPYLKTILPGILGRCGALPASEARDGEPIEEGHIYVARSDRHLLVDRGIMCVTAGPKENGCRPAIDVLFRSAARAYGPRVIAVVLSGLLDDGAAGALAVKRRGGLLVVQAPEDAAFSDMPQAALDTVGTADYTIPLTDVPLLLSMLSRLPAPCEGDLARPLQQSSPPTSGAAWPRTEEGR
jgi:two-component system chemotaxis response regulator CheB